LKKFPVTKRGDTFAFIALMKDAFGDPLVGRESSLKAEVRTYSDALVDSLIITETDEGGRYLFRAGDTSDWPLNTQLMMDIQYTDTDLVVSSETISIPMERGITR